MAHKVVTPCVTSAGSCMAGDTGIVKLILTIKLRITDEPRYMVTCKCGGILLAIRFASVSRSRGQGRLNQPCPVQVHIGL